MEDNIIIINILNKINEDIIRIQTLKNYFNVHELEIIQNMIKDGSVTNTYNKEINEEVITLTNKGKFTLFTYNHQKEIDIYAKKLESMHYDTTYLSDYLKSSILNADINNIFSIERYDIFMYNINFLKNNNKIARRILINNRNIG